MGRVIEDRSHGLFGKPPCGLETPSPHRAPSPVIAEDLELLILCESSGWRKHDREEVSLRLFSGRYPSTHANALVGLRLSDGAQAWRCPVTPELKDFLQVEPEIVRDKKFGVNKQRFHAVAYRDGRVFCLYACQLGLT